MPFPSQLIAPDFPWDLCRRIYSYPGSYSLRFLQGYSEDDGDFLLVNAFNDAKTILREWINWQRSNQAGYYPVNSLHSLATDALFMRGLCLRASQTTSPLADKPPSSLKSALKTTTSCSSLPSSPSPYFMIIAQAFLLLYVPMHAQDLLEEFIFSQDGGPNGEFEEFLELVEPIELASMLQKAFVSLKVQLIAAGVLKDDSDLLQSSVRFAARPGRPPKNPAPTFPPGSSLIEQANLGQPGETGCKRPWALLTGEEAVPKKRGN